MHIFQPYCTYLQDTGMYHFGCQNIFVLFSFLLCFRESSIQSSPIFFFLDFLKWFDLKADLSLDLH